MALVGRGGGGGDRRRFRVHSFGSVETHAPFNTPVATSKLTAVHSFGRIYHHGAFAADAGVKA